MQELTNTITIIGAGSVGSTCAYTLMMQVNIYNNFFISKNIN